MKRDLAQALVLASGSARRRELLLQAGVRIRAVVPDVDESLLPGEAPAAAVQRLARTKAEAVSNDCPTELVLGADTLVCYGDAVLGKPEDLAAARQMIRMLAGHTHRVYTGVCLTRRQPPCKILWHAVTAVTFHRLDDHQIDVYLDAAEPLDKAGAYAIQEHGGRLVAGYDGLYSTVVGLPVEEVVDRLRDLFGPDR